uniref:Endoplasmic reticulum lectin 1 n=1 Tax=Lutzomyia longipalpis TaxID=7200 RepID=A0A1B0CUJ1_LUTLO
MRAILKCKQRGENVGGGNSAFSTFSASPAAVFQGEGVELSKSRGKLFKNHIIQEKCFCEENLGKRKDFCVKIMQLSVQIVLLLWLHVGLSLEPDLKGFDDNILYKINWPGKIDDLTVEDTDNSPYMGPAPLDLLMPLFASAQCSIRIESYWTYEVCHGLYVKQFHEERDGKSVKTQEYHLGRWDWKNEALREKIMQAEQEKGDTLQERREKEFFVQGTGWWRYEFCYGRYVRQYHGDTSLILGFFDEKLHREWIEKHPHKRPKPKNVRTELTHFYQGGSECDKTGERRETEVKLKCLENATSKTSVSLYLLEPQTCQYILGVESPLICEILQKADDDGLVASLVSQKAPEKGDEEHIVGNAIIEDIDVRFEND